MKLEMSLLAGPESKAFLVGLTQQIDRLEKLVTTVGSAAASVEAQEVADLPEETHEAAGEEEAESDFMEPAPKKVATKKAAATAFDDEEEAEEPAAPPKKAKAVTPKEANDACIAAVRARGNNKKAREEVLAILKKKFKTTSVQEIDPKNYAELIKAVSL